MESAIQDLARQVSYYELIALWYPDDAEIEIVDDNVLRDAWFDDFDETTAALSVEPPRRRARPWMWLFGAAVVVTAAACVGASAI